MRAPYILVVESNPILAKMLLSILGDQLGFQTLRAATIKDALMIIKTHLPRFLLLDEVLLDGEGITFYDYLHRHVAIVPLPTIMLSRHITQCQQWVGQRHITCVPLSTKSEELAQALANLLS